MTSWRRADQTSRLDQCRHPPDHPRNIDQMGSNRNGFTPMDKEELFHTQGLCPQPLCPQPLIPQALCPQPPSEWLRPKPQMMNRMNRTKRRARILHLHGQIVVTKPKIGQIITPSKLRCLSKRLIPRGQATKSDLLTRSGRLRILRRRLLTRLSPRLQGSKKVTSPLLPRHLEGLRINIS